MPQPEVRASRTLLVEAGLRRMVERAAAPRKAWARPSAQVLRMADRAKDAPLGEGAASG